MASVWKNEMRLLVSAHSSALWHSMCAAATCDSSRHFCHYQSATYLPSALWTSLAHEIFEVQEPQEPCFYRLSLFFFACFRWGEIPLALMQWRGSHFVLAAIDYYFLPLLLFSTPLLFNLLGNSGLITAKSGCFMSFIMCEVKYSFAKA